MADIDVRKVMDVVYDETKELTVNGYRTELILKLNALMEQEVNKFLDAIADDELEGEYKTPIKTVIPDEEEDANQLPIEYEEPTTERMDRKGTSKVWKK